MSSPLRSFCAALVSLGLLAGATATSTAASVPSSVSPAGGAPDSTCLVRGSQTICSPDGGGRTAYGEGRKLG